MEDQASGASSDTAGGPPAWLALALDVDPFDVRPLLARAEDPLAAILNRAAKVEFGAFLVVDAPFNPSPLRRVLAAQGFSSYGRRLSPSHWRIFFHMDGGQDWERDAEVEAGPEGALTWREADGLHIDVRGLTPPLPMLAVLRTIEVMAMPEAMVVHHERVPRFLFPELAERGWKVARISEEFADVRLWLEPEG
jgi:hypothetical protein